MSKTGVIKRSDAYKNFTIGILSTVVSGLLMYLGSFFTTQIPDINRRIENSEIKIDNVQIETNRRLDSIDRNIQIVDERVHKMYELMMREK